LHRLLQCVMGWEDAHLYQFVVSGVRYGDPRLLGELDAEDARTVPLAMLGLREKVKFLYEYDFGDSWEHELLVEKILPRDEGKRYPVCLTGKRACPPEDCGGIWGYRVFWKRSAIPSTPSMTRGWNGWEASSIRTSYTRSGELCIIFSHHTS